MNTRVLFAGDIFLLDLRDVVQNFEKSDEGFWCNFVFIDFQGEFLCHCLEDGGFKTVFF